MLSRAPDMVEEGAATASARGQGRAIGGALTRLPA